MDPATENVSLRPYNTFGMDVPAAALLDLHEVADLAGIARDARLPRPLRILGGGSNVLLAGPVRGTVVRNLISGIAVVAEDAAHIWLRAGGGESWHGLVEYAVARGLGGIENLALIPGTVGASPIQNIGAYGVEVKNTVWEVQAWDWEDGVLRIFSNEECLFGYRDSIFKGELKGRVVVTAVTFRLDKVPVLNIEYGAIREELERMSSTPEVASVAQAVMAIRRSKLPDPAVIGNAGSFFKNPVVPTAHFGMLRASNPAMPSYPAGDGFVKVPAGWLIEACGWKGFRRGDAGIHARQALVLVNYGDATGSEIWALSEEVVCSVKERFGIELEREVQVW